MTSHNVKGAQWLSGRVLDSRPKGCGFKPRRVTALCPCRARHINPNLVLVQPRKTHPFILERLLMGCKESNKQIKHNLTTTMADSLTATFAN